jgi:hypothetical protein
MTYKWTAALALIIATGACSKDTTGTVDDDGGGPVAEAAILPTLARATVSNRYTAEVAVSGTSAYTTTWGSRPEIGNTTFVWDIGPTHASPVIVDSLQVADATTIGDVQISPDGHYLVVATERKNGSIVIYDRTNPLHPTFVSRYLSANTSNGVHTMKMSVIDGKLYGFLQIDPGPGPARLTIVDMSNPSKVTEVYSQTMGNPYIHDVFVRDGYLFAAVWNDGMTIFDIGGHNTAGSPSQPVQLGSVSPAAGHIHNIWWFHDQKTGSKKYAFLGEENIASVGTTSSGDIHVVDVSNFANPKEVAIFNVPGAGTHNFWVDEESGILYAAYYNGGVRAINVRGDLSTCTNAQKNSLGLCDLRLMGREVGKALHTGGFYIWGVAGLDSKLYASDMNSGLVVLDISSLMR